MASTMDSTVMKVAKDGPVVMDDGVYKLARTKWTQQTSSLLVSRDNWQRIAFGAMGAALLSIAGCIYLGSLPKTVPFIIQVDKSGAVAATGAAQASSLTDAQWASIKNLAFQNFIENWRSVSTDAAYQKRIWDRAYRFVGDNSPAKHFLDDWYREHNPEIRSHKEVVSTRILSSGEAGANTYQVWWEETAVAFDGEPKVQQWRATFTYAIAPAKNIQPGDVNPLRILITQIWLAPVASGEAAK